jgi:hypothetical protein
MLGTQVGERHEMRPSNLLDIALIALGNAMGESRRSSEDRCEHQKTAQLCGQTGKTAEPDPTRTGWSPLD